MVPAGVHWNQAQEPTVLEHFFNIHININMETYHVYVPGCLQKTIQNIQSISDQVIFPTFKSEKFLKCKSLARLGFNAKHSGIPCRPWLPNNSLTMQAVWKYLHALSYKQGLDRPIVLPPGEPFVHFENIPITYCQRNWDDHPQYNDS